MHLQQIRFLQRLEAKVVVVEVTDVAVVDVTVVVEVVVVVEVTEVNVVDVTVVVEVVVDVVVDVVLVEGKTRRRA